MIPPLRLIFWGGLICVLDLKITQVINGEGWQFDFLNDFVGMLLITWSLFQLARFQVDLWYQKVMSFLKVVCVLGCFETLHAHLIYHHPPPLAFALTLLGMANLIAGLVFCMAMQRLSEAAELPGAVQSWRTTAKFYAVICLIPIGLFQCLSVVCVVTGQKFHIDLGPAGLIIIPLILFPLIHMFISVSRMRNEAVLVDELLNEYETKVERSGFRPSN